MNDNIKQLLKDALSKVSGDKNIEDSELNDLISELSIPDNLDANELNKYLWEKVQNFHKNNPSKKVSKIRNFGSMVVANETAHNNLVDLINTSIKSIADKSYRLSEINGTTDNLEDSDEGYITTVFTYSSNVLDNQLGMITIFFQNTPPVLSGQIQSITAAPSMDAIDLLNKITAEDVVDGDISNKIEIGYNGINIKKEGQYPVVYNVKNSRSVNSRLCIWYTVVSKYPKLEARDIEIPAGTLLDEHMLRNYVDAEDAVDGNITNQIQIKEGTSSWKQQGTYAVHAIVENSNGKQATCLLNVKVTAKAPSICINELQFNAGTNITRELVLANIEVTDEVDGDITDQVRFDLANVDSKVAGQYQLLFSVENSNKVQAEKKETLRIVAEKPRIEAHDFVVPLNTRVDWIKAAAVKASDSVDGDLTSVATYFNSDVKLNQLGDYSVYYMVRNSNGEQATTKINVHVVEPE